ncbi:hypothetical protein K1719_001629 [Acacia pycnantha]|nr:hypothetical protein K1719_001629 [Acacia pycnantha]
MATGGNNSYLPQEIIIEILKRLRVKWLVRFRAVCKDWRNLLKSPSFIEEHYHHSTHKNPLLVCHVNNRNPIYSPLCSLRYEKETVKAERILEMDCLRRVNGLIGSSNDLLCVRLDFEKDDTPIPLLLLNPATREIRQVPRSTNEDCSYCYFGFGYSPVVRDYKIVRIHSAGGKTNIRRMNSHNIWVEGVDVYSLRTGSWKEVEVGVIYGALDLFNPVAVNGAIFWIGWEANYLRHVIISFDLEMEFFELIPMPSSNSADLPLSRCVLDAYENKLVLIHEYLHVLEVPHYIFIDLWVLEEGSGRAYGKS